MKEKIGTAIAATALGATLIVGGTMALDSKPTKHISCAEVDCGSPVASPVASPTVAIPTPTPEVTVTVEPTTLSDVITELPSTGTGSSR